MNFKQYFPIFKWLPNYTKSLLKPDLIAGLTVWVMLVPQGMAYALLAGMPPIYGLYGSLIPLLIYGFLGTSRHLSIGPVAIDALLILAGISQIAVPGSPEYIGYVILTGLLIGIIQTFASFIRLGFLVNFLSHPVLAGFTSAAAIIIAVSQLKYLLGIDIPRFSALTDTVGYAITHIGETNLPSFLLCVSGITLMLILKKVNKTFPGALLAVVLGILAVKLFNLETKGIEIVKGVPEGLPHFQIPPITLANIKLVLPTVLTVTIIGIVESIGIAKVWEAKHRNYKINPNQELLALGVSKIGGAFFQALPTSGSFTRSAINSESGAKTQFSSILTALLIGLTLIFLTPLFYYLPNAILAAIILLSIKSLFDIQEAVHLWKTDRGDFIMMLATFIITLILGIEEGVLAGVVLSVMMVMYRSSKPHIAVLGQLPNTNYYRNVDRFPDAIKIPGCIIMRFDSQLFFANALYFQEFIESLVENQNKPITVLILDASSIHDIDSSGMQVLGEVSDFLKKNRVKFYITSIIGPVRDRMYRSGLMNKIGRENQFLYIQDAVNYFSKEQELSKDWMERATQTNYNFRKPDRP